jgi:RNA polymerase sigma-70 factor (ECF subfamily)
MDSEDDEIFIPTRQSLLERLRQWDDREGWQQFFDTYWKLIFRTAQKAGLTAVEAEEVVQETIISVAGKMPEFQYRPKAEGGSFKKWLLQLTKWRIVDEYRKRESSGFLVPLNGSVDGADHLEIPDLVADRLDLLWEAEWERSLLDGALENIKRQADPKHYQIFFLTSVKQWSPARVARSMNVSLAQVYTVRHRLTKQLKKSLETIKTNANSNI